MRSKISITISAVIFTSIGVVSFAQNFSSPGGDWSAGWGFQSATDRSIAIQQAQAIRSAAMEQSAGPATVVNNTSYNSYDNRSGYVDAGGNGAAYGNLDIHLNGDKIGQNTNSIGAMNTGTTNIDIRGDGNVVEAINAADSQGCIDGSVTLTDTPFASMETASGIDITLDVFRQTVPCME